MSDRTVCDEWADDFRGKLRTQAQVKDTRIAYLERELEEARADAAAVRELMNVYNLGG